MEYRVLTTEGYVSINRRELERLRMLSDWQLRQEGYDPASVTCLCLKVDAKS